MACRPPELNTGDRPWAAYIHYKTIDQRQIKEVRKELSENSMGFSAEVLQKLRGYCSK